MNVKLEDLNQKNLWFSNTGYRVFLIFKSLLEAPKTLEELLFIVQNDHYCRNDISKDTIRFDINTLRSAGCVISRPTNTNKFKYEISYHPFNFSLSNDEIDVLLELKDIIINELSFDDIFILNNLYEKIASFTRKNEKVNIMRENRTLYNIDINKFKMISNPKLVGRKVQIKYNSPKYGEENIYVIPVKILYENRKAYLSAYNYKYQCNSFFEISRIIGINHVSPEIPDIDMSVLKVIYEVKGESLNTFEIKSYEKIIEQTKDKIVVEADVINEFMFIQRLFLLGKDFKIILPDFFRLKLLKKIKLIKKRYTDD